MVRRPFEPISFHALKSQQSSDKSDGSRSNADVDSGVPDETGSTGRLTEKTLAQVEPSQEMEVPSTSSPNALLTSDTTKNVMARDPIPNQATGEVDTTGSLEKRTGSHEGTDVHSSDAGEDMNNSQQRDDHVNKPINGFPLQPLERGAEKSFQSPKQGNHKNTMRFNTAASGHHRQKSSELRQSSDIPYPSMTNSNRVRSHSRSLSGEIFVPTNPYISTVSSINSSNKPENYTLLARETAKNTRSEYDQFVKNVNLLPIYRMDVGKHKTKESIMKNMKQSQDKAVGQQASPLLQSHGFQSPTGSAKLVSHDQVSPTTIKLSAMTPGTITSLGNTPQRPLYQLEQHLYNNQQIYSSPIANVGVSDGRMVASRSDPNDTGGYNNSIQHMSPNNENDGIGMPLINDINEFNGMHGVYTGTNMPSEPSLYYHRRSDSRNAMNSYDSVMAYNKLKRIRLNNDYSPASSRFNTSSNVIIMQNTPNIGFSPTRHQQNQKNQRIKLKMQSQMQQRRQQQNIGQLEQLGQLEHFNQLERMNQVGNIEHTEQPSYSTQPNHANHYSNHKMGYSPYSQSHDHEHSVQVQQFASQQHLLRNVNQDGQNIENDVSYLESDNISFKSDGNNINQNEYESNQTGSSDILYTLDVSTVNRLFGAIQNLQSSLTNVEHVLCDQKCNIIRLEQKLARSINERRGSGLELPYEILPWIGGHKLPLLSNVFVIFSLTPTQLGKYLSVYSIASTALQGVDDGEYNDHECGNGGRDAKDDVLETANIHKTDGELENTHKNGGGKSTDGDNTGRDMCESNRIQNTGFKADDFNATMDDPRNNGIGDKSGKTAGDSTDKNGMFKLAEFIGCGEVEKYWDVYLDERK